MLKKDFVQKKRRGGKLDPKWVGPYIITAKHSKGFCSLRSIENPVKIIKRVSGAHLKVYHQQQTTPSPHQQSNSSTPPASPQQPTSTQLFTPPVSTQLNTTQQQSTPSASPQKSTPPAITQQSSPPAITQQSTQPLYAQKSTLGKQCKQGMVYIFNYT